MDISSIIGTLWKGYKFSSDGKQFNFQTEQYTLQFEGIIAIALRPASIVEQEDPDKEVQVAVQYRVAEHLVAPRRILAESYGSTVEVGPPYLPLRLSGELSQLRKFKAFHISASPLDVTLVCRTLIML